VDPRGSNAFTKPEKINTTPTTIRLKDLKIFIGVKKINFGFATQDRKIKPIDLH